MTRLSVLLPPEWAMVDCAKPVPSQVTAAVARMLRTVPTNTARRLGPVVTRQLTDLVSGLVEAGAALVLLPTTGLNTDPYRPVVVITPLSLPEGTLPIDHLVALAASDPSATLVESPHAVGVRLGGDAKVGEASGRVPELTEALTEGDPESRRRLDALEGPWVSHRVRYLIGDPTSTKDWVEVFFTLDTPDAEDAREHAALTGRLVDALVTSIRWKDS